MSARAASGVSGAAALMVSTALTLSAALHSDGPTARLLATIGAAGIAVLAVGLISARPVGLTTGVSLLGLTYALHLVLDDPALDGRVSLVAAGLLAVAELSFWSTELRRELTGEPGRRLRRLAFELTLVLGGMLLAAAVLATADVGRVGGIGIELVGTAAAAILFALALLALRRRRT